MTRSFGTAVLLGAFTGLFLPCTLHAQSLSQRISQVSQNEQRTTRRADPRAVTLRKLSQPISLEVTDQPLRDVITFIEKVQGVEILAHYATDTADGLDPEQPITINFHDRPALSLIKMLLSMTETEYDGNAWQFTDYGALEIGPKQNLNKRKYTVIYPVQDLLVDIPRHDDAPDLSLQTALQQGGGRGGGGGGANIFSGTGGDTNTNTKTEKEMADDLVELIENSIEPDQWLDNGGDGANIRFFRGNLIISAPDYIHRQINGYPWWPSGSYYSSVQAAPRYVSLGVDLQNSRVLNIAQREVTAVSRNGNLVTSGP